MRAAVLALAAAIAGGVNARDSHAGRRHAHMARHEASKALVSAAEAAPTCGCTTIYTTITGQPSLYNPPAPATSAAPSTSAVSIASAVPTPTPSSVAPHSTATPAIPVPTPMISTVDAPGTYTIPATTLTVTATTTVCGAETTTLPAGNQTYGGITTSVVTATTIVCPIAVVTTNTGVVTSTIELTTYICPTGGVYTIAPITTSLPAPAVVVFPTPAVITPGVYTRPEIVTVIDTQTVIYCPLTPEAPKQEAPKTSAAASTSAAPTTAPAPAPPAPTVEAPKPEAPKQEAPKPEAPKPEAPKQEAPKPEAPKQEAPKPEAPKQEAPKPEAPAPAPTSAAPPANSAPATTPSKPTGNLGSTGGNKWAITYSPYTDGGACKGAAEVAADIAVIKAAGFEAVRIYSTDCSGLVNVGNACTVSKLRMIIGVFISGTGISGAQTQVDAIISWGKFELVDLIVVGNEAVFNGFCTATALAEFIIISKTKFVGGGYHGQVTTTEPLNVWQGNTAALCGAVDVVGANIHPFFNADVTAENAGPFTLSQLKIVEGLCPGKKGINLETGWPSAGRCNGKACPGADNQAIALKSITQSCGSQSVMFSYIDEPWKPSGEFGVEQHWGALKHYG